MPTGLRVVFLGLQVLTWVYALHSQGGPPLITDDPGTPGNHHWEINVAYTQARVTGSTSFGAPDLDINYGAGDHVQLNFEIPCVVQTAHDNTIAGLGNSKAGVKWRFLDQDKHGLDVSTYPHIVWNNPTNSVRRGLADDGLQVFLPLEFSKHVGKFEINGESGFNIQQHLRNELWLGLAVGIQASGRVELLSELHSILTAAFAENESVFGLGGRVKLTRVNTLLFSAGRSLPGSTDHEPKFFMYLGMQFAF